MSCVPKITKNLVCISKLLSDNNVFIEFSSNMCFVKYKMEGILLAQAIAKDGLYKLLSQDDSNYLILSENQSSKLITLGNESYYILYRLKLRSLRDQIKRVITFWLYFA